MTVTLEPKVDRPVAKRTVAPTRAGAPAPTLAGIASWRSMGRADIVEIARRGALAFTALVVAFAGFLWLGSGLQEGRRQTGLERKLRVELMDLKAPVGGDIAEGAPIARLHVGSAAINQIVVQGTTATDLRAGPGHLRASVLPGQVGNAVIMARRFTYGGPFRDLGNVHIGDAIAVTTGQGIAHYEVTKIATRSGRDASAFLSTSDARLTLVTSSSALTASGYKVVVAKLTSKPFASTGRVGVIRRDELGLTGDSSTAPLLFLWLVALAGAALAVVWGSRARPGPVAWLLSVPVLLALMWLVFDNVAPLLPALL